MSQQLNHIFIATLSTEPQGVTRVLDWLLAQNFPIVETIVVHTSGEVIRPSLAALAAEFAGGVYPGIRFRPVLVAGDDGPVADIRSGKDAGLFLQTVYREIRQARQKGWPIHLSITSGRKTMAVYSMVAAQLLFTEQDHVWHMVSTERFSGREKKLHAEPGEVVEMVSVPVLRWADAGTMAALLETTDPWTALQRQQTFTQGEQARRVKEFLNRWLTKRERELVILLVQTGLDNAGLAQRLGKKEQTVANQLTQIYRKFEEWQGFQGAGSRSVLLATLRPYVGDQI